MADTVKDVFYLARQAYARFSQDRCARVGAALAYYTFFSLFPLLLLLIASLGYLLASGMPQLVDARTYVLEQAAQVMPQVTEPLEKSIDQALQARGSVGFVGLLTLLWSASNVFTQLYQALNMIWGCTPDPTIWSAIRTKLTAIAMVLGVSLLLLLSVLFNASLPVAVRYVRPLPWWRSLWAMSVPLSSAAMATAIFGLLYRYLPDTKVSWRHVWPGALLAGTAWELLRQAFTIYTTRYANYAAVYGAVGSTIALLSWIYLSAQILLFGAEFSVVYGELKTRPRSRADAPAGTEGRALREQAEDAWHRLLDAIKRAWG